MNELTSEEYHNLSDIPFKKDGGYIVAARDNKKLIKAMQACVDQIEKDGLNMRDFELICIPHSNYEAGYVDPASQGFAAFLKRKRGYELEKADQKRQDHYFHIN